MYPAKRAPWADLTRVIAIYLVIVTHTTTPGDYRSIYDSISLTCIPLFILLSGALLLGKQESYAIFFKKRFTRILLPWLCWSLVFSLTFSTRFFTTLESFWFLPLILGLYLVTPALRIWISAAKPKDVWFLLTLYFLAVSVLPYSRDSLMFPLHVDDGIVRQIINYLGYYLLGYELTQTKIKHPEIISLSLIIIGLIISSFVTSAYTSPGVALTAVGIFMLIRCLDFPKSKLLMWMSDASLGIYFVHTLIQKFIIFPFDNFTNGLILLIASASALWLLAQVPIIKKLVI